MRRSAIVTGVCVVLVVAVTAGGKIIYVDDDAPPGGDGRSWQTAYRYLQDALTDAKAAEKPIEVRVAQGVYKPDRGANRTVGDRMASFELMSGVVLKGGFAGLPTSDPNARDIKLYETILSGDLASNDVLSEDPADFVVDPNDGNWDRPKVWNILIESTRRENSVHVLVANGADQTAVLEGCTITAGNAYHPPYQVAFVFDDHDRAGALLNKGASFALISCMFIANSAIGGAGAVQNEGPCQPVFVDCSFLGNLSWNGGGGAVNGRSANMIVKGCTFEGNGSWTSWGTAMYSASCHHEIVDCRFLRNGRTGGYAMSTVHVDMGDGVFDHCEFEYNPQGGLSVTNRSNLLIQGSKFMGNLGDEGGGINCSGVSKVKLDKCMFVRNHAALGGGLYISSTELSVSNCLFYANQTDFPGFGGGGAGAAVHGNSVVDVRSSVFCNNQSPGGYEIALLLRSEGPTPSTGTIAYCLIEGGQAGIWTGRGYTFVTEAPPKDRPGVFVWGPGNIDADPLFADPNGGDYHVKSQAGRWDQVSSNWVVDDVTSVCIDGGDSASAIGREPFPNGGRINMGPYGGTAEASKSYFGEPACETIVAGDINGDCRVDFRDLAIMAISWLEDRTPHPMVTTTYSLVEDMSSVVSYCGRGGTRKYSLEGTLDLTIDLTAATAVFDRVDVTSDKTMSFIDERNEAGAIPVETNRLDTMFHMTELVSTDVTNTEASFAFHKNIAGFPGADIRVTLVFKEDSVSIAGRFSDPVADGCWHDLNAVAMPLGDP